MSEQTNEWNHDITQAPYGVVLEVSNDGHEFPALATRGFINRRTGRVCSDQKLFTTIYCDEPGKYHPTGSGQLACPTKWRHPPEPIEL